ARRRKEYAITEAGRAELRRWLVAVPPKPNQRDEPLLRVFFLDQVEPGEALNYLGGMAERTRQPQQRRNTVPRDDGGGLADNGRLTLEYGKRFLAMRHDWFIWAREQFRTRVEGRPQETAHTLPTDDAGSATT
ncbi:hypothetical protein ACFFNX_32020, partial [Actinoallomurus acaciae]